MKIHLSRLTNRKLHLKIFILSLSIRLLFSLITGYNDHYSRQSDSLTMIMLSNQIVEGNYNLDIGRFIVSPLYPFLIAITKILTSSWETTIFLIQLVYLSFTSVLIFNISTILFDKKTGIYSSLIYSIFPLTFWYVNTFSQECIFQCFVVTFFYFFIKSLKKQRIKDVILSGLFFALAFLTKSHILLFSIFIPLIYWKNLKEIRKTFLFTSIIAGISLTLTIPFGMYNYVNYNTYVLSSNGAAYQFYLGNTGAGYITIVNPPSFNSKAFNKMQDINNTAGYLNGHPLYYDSLLHLPQSEKQNLFIHAAIDWIVHNPRKFITLKLKNIQTFLTPGVSNKHYSMSNWLIAFLFSLPLYLLSSLGIFYGIKRSLNENIWIVYLIITMLLFSTIWYTQNRFRTITLEPFFCLYAGYGFQFLQNNYRFKKSPNSNR